ncbi:uncharacterized protein LOC128858671 [Anastrepha ludens]|uniref:uncharacterized protein LOC128858671 n=1 Tax=Anastrepha ludens TaxID=28586 RepID=UPI0023AF2EC0|nr:uncharacterized protein LOC128858671 [Anastrepha ludens]
MDVNKKINIRLVQTVEKYPCIYNTSLTEYSKRDHTERAWIEVAEELSSTPDVVKDRWKCIRSVFVRRLKQMHMGELSKPYYLHQHLQFLVPFLQKPWDPESRTKRLLEESENRVRRSPIRKKSIDINDTSDYFDNTHEDNLDTIYLGNSSKGKRMASATSEDDDFHGFADYRSTKLQPPAKQRVIRDAPYFSNITQSDEANGDDNPKRLFMLSLLPDLEEMNNAQMREFKTKVITLINEIFEESLDGN